MPMDLVEQIKEWLGGRTFYDQVGEDCSALFDSDVGTIVLNMICREHFMVKLPNQSR